MAESLRDVPSVADILRSATRALQNSSPTPRLDAEVLLAHVLGVDRARLVIEDNAQLEVELYERFDRLARRRMIGEPVPYLTGARGFRTLTLDVDRRVLIPRPETEELVDAALDELPQGASVLDVGTGSGAIALAIAAERPDMRVEAVDVSPDAVAAATANMQKLNLAVSFSVADLLDGARPVDAVIANLPYVERDAPLPVDVASFEPPLALFGGDDGLALIRRLAAQLAARRWPAWVFLEIGESQGEAVATLVRSAGFIDAEVRADLSGRDRIVIGRRPAGARP